jgi:hypothetical protein
LLGIGFSVFLSVDFAIPTEALPAATDRTEVLPTATDRGKALGVINATHSVRIRANQNPLVGDGGQRLCRQAAPAGPGTGRRRSDHRLAGWLSHALRGRRRSGPGRRHPGPPHPLSPRRSLRPAFRVCSSLLVVTVDNRLPAASGAHTLDLVRRYAGRRGRGGAPVRTERNPLWIRGTALLRTVSVGGGV